MVSVGFGLGRGEQPPALSASCRRLVRCFLAGRVPTGARSTAGSTPLTDTSLFAAGLERI